MVEKKPTRTAQTNTKADAVLSMFDQIAEDVLLSVQAKIDRRVAAKVKHLEEAINQARPIFIQTETLTGKSIEGLQHNQFENLIKIVLTGQPVVLVGPAGTGKSHAAEAVATALDLQFYAMSVGAQTSKSDLIGYMDANKNYQTTAFRQAYEEGGLFLLDEIDAGNSNVLIQLNAALANGYMSFPDKMIRRHEQFRFVASANTFGSGANRQYVGRNQLDAATIDRFAFLQWNIDNRVEESLAIGKYGDAWLDCVRHARKFVEEQELRVVVSPRATQRGSLLLAAGLDFNDVLHMALLSQFAQEEKLRMHNELHSMFRERSAEIDKAVTDAEPEPEPAPTPEESASVTIDASWSGMEIWAYAIRGDRKGKHMFDEDDFHDMSMAEFDQAAENAEKIISNLKAKNGVDGVNSIAIPQIKGLILKSQDEVASMSNMEMLLANEIIRNSSPANSFWEEISESLPVE
jgi:cobaltochelatase CobS